MNVLARWCIAPLLVLVGLAAPCLAASSAADQSLLDAARQGDIEAVRSMINDGADVNLPADDGTTALIWSAHRNEMQMAELLITAGADVNRANDYGATALYEAAGYADAALIDMLLSVGANANAALLSSQTPLMMAANRGMAESVNLLLSGGADPDAKESKGGQTALMWSAAEGHSAVTEILIEHGADVHLRSNGGFSALMFAAQKGDAQSVEALLDAGANVDERMPETGLTPLLIATALRHEDVVALLLDRNANPNAVEAGDGFTSLHRAASDRNSLGIVNLLLAHGADPNVRLLRWDRRKPYMLPPYVELKGATPLLLAADVRSFGAVKALLDAGADPLIPTEKNTTPLIMAAGGGADPSRPRPAKELVGTFETVELLVEKGVDVNAAGEFGWTALHVASYLGRNDVVQFLASKGANVNAMDGFGQTPLSIASYIITEGLGGAFFQSPRAYHRDTIDLLLALGATPIEQSGVKVVFQRGRNE